MNLSRMCIAVTLGISAMAAAAAPAKPGERHVDRHAIEQQYRADREACMAMPRTDARHTCLREAGAARQDALAGKLGVAGATSEALRQNRLARCAVHRDAVDRRACEAMALGAGERNGSVTEGAVVREMVVQVKPEP